MASRKRERPEEVAPLQYQVAGAYGSPATISGRSRSRLAWVRGLIHSAGISCVALSKDARLALSASDRTVRLFDVTSGRKLFAFEGHEDVIFNVAFCPDGERIVSASRDGTIRVWRLPEH